MAEGSTPSTTTAPELEEEGPGLLVCRMYEQKYPEVDDLVIVQVKSIAEMGAYVSLLEYDDIEGMILMSELSRRRIRSVNKLIRVGRQEIVLVLRVDKEKGYIDLSKRRVSPEDVAAFENKWNKAKAVHSIMRHVSKKTDVPVIQLYKQWGWEMYRQYKHGYDAFKLAVTDEESFFKKFDVPEHIRPILMENVRRRLTPQAVKIRADIELTCFSYEGIDAIKASLKKGLELSSDDLPVQIKLVAPPLFVITTSTLEKADGIQRLWDVCKVVEDTIRGLGGSMVLKHEPRAVTARDNDMLDSMLERAEAENRQVDGDAPEDS